MNLKSVQESWSKVAPNRDRVGEKFFQELFDAAPELQPLFQNDSKTQGRQFAGMLNIVINGFDQLPLIEESLQKLGARHVNSGVTAENVKLMEDTLIRVLGKELGNDFDKEQEIAWRFIFETIVRQMGLL